MELATRGRYRFFLYLYSFVIIVIGAVLAGWGVFRTLPAGLGEGYHAVQATLRGIEQILLWRVALLYTVIAALIIAATAVLHLFYSHRIAGPAHRIGLEAAKIGNGSLAGNIKFREKDNLMDMADSLNDLAARYRSRINTVGESLTIIEARSSALARMINEGKNGSELRQTAEEIAASVKKIEYSLAEMRI
jgi:methyl-accepting chemotaxis protein